MRAGQIGLVIGILGLSGDFAAAEQLPPVEADVIENVSETGFQTWVRDFRARALAAGIAPATFEAAFAGVHLDEGIVTKDRNQNEFSKQIWDYLDTAVSEQRVENGKQALTRQNRVLTAIEERYRVDKEVVAAIWGLESAYGSYRGTTPVIEALAVLAYDGRRAGFFETQLIAALRILEHGDVTLDRFTGSWAGAMGHTQFMPTSWAEYAVDFQGDGKRDIWSDDPADALASTASYLERHGWVAGQPWGMEVTLPEGFDYRLTGERVKKPVESWTSLGVRDIDGGAIADHGLASILLPAGWQGAAFMIFENFHVLEKYNTADAYVIAVGSLSDRLKGGPPIRHGWPRDDRALSGDEKREMQRLLTEKGFDPVGIDGIMGPNTIQAVRLFQASRGMVQDGYGSLEILTLLRE